MGSWRIEKLFAPITLLGDVTPKIHPVTPKIHPPHRAPNYSVHGVNPPRQCFWSVEEMPTDNRFPLIQQESEKCLHRR
jgi:hypothetical protein